MYTYGRKSGCRISLDYTYRGMRLAFLENEVIQVGILLEKGADVFEFKYKPLDLDVMWQSPLEMRMPFVSTSALPEGYFHDYYYGGGRKSYPPPVGLQSHIWAPTRGCMVKSPYCLLRQA